MKVSATDLLRTYSAPSLQQMARHRLVQTKGTSKERLIGALAPVLYDGNSVRAALAELIGRERMLLDRIILAGGQVRTAIVKAQLEDEGITLPARTDGRFNSYFGSRETGELRVRDSTKFEDLVARLGAYGLVFTAEPIGTSGYIVETGRPGHRLFIPDEILKHLPAVNLPVEIVQEPEVIVTSDPTEFLRDLYLLLSYASLNPIALTTKGLIVKRTLAKIASTLRHVEDVSLAKSEDELFWLPLVRAIGEELGLLVTGAGELAMDSRAPEFFQLPVEVRRLRIFDAYRVTAHLSEIYQIPDLVISGRGISPRFALPEVVIARQRVLRELSCMPVGEWIKANHLAHRMNLGAFEFLIARNRTNSYYSYSYDDVNAPYAGYNTLGLTFRSVNDVAVGWNDVEARFIWAMLEGPLHALGIIDLGGTETRITAIRITEDGGRLLRGEPLPPVASESNVVVQPNFQIFAFEPTNEDVLFKLDLIADRINADQAIEYELTRSSVQRALQTGIDTAAVIDFLATTSTVPLPQNVQRSIEEWGGQVERITLLSRTPVIQVLRPQILDELYQDPEFALLLGRRVSPTAALVADVDIRKLCNTLIERGHLPSRTEGTGDPAVNGARAAIRVDGRIEFFQQLPSLFDLAMVRPFSEGPDGGLKLTPESLRRGAKRSLTADDIIAALEHLQACPVSEEVSALVRRWAKDWGHGALFETAILQVDQEGTLADLLLDPELRPWLQAIPGVPTIALVRREAVKKLRSLLADRGMSLYDKLMR